MLSVEDMIEATRPIIPVVVLCFLLGYIKFGILWSLLIAIVSTYSVLRADLLKRFKIRTLLQRQLNDPNLLHTILKDKVPAWINLSQGERALWLNTTLGKLWPHLKTATEAAIKGSLNPLLASVRPPFLTTLELSNCDLGANPPTIASITPHTTQDTITLDLAVQWTSHSDLVLRAGTGPANVTFRICDVSVSGRVRVVAGPMLRTLPGIKAIAVSFVDRPQLDYTLKAQNVSLNIIPGLKDFIKDLVDNSINTYLVQPHRILIPLTQLTEEDLAAHDTSKGVGLLRVKVLSAKSLKNVDYLTLSDPIAECSVEGQTFQTKQVDNDLNPTWNESFEWIVYDNRTAAFTCRVMSGSSPLGYVQIDVASLQHNSWHSLNLPLTDGEGRIQLEMQFKPFIEVPTFDPKVPSTRFNFPQPVPGEDWSSTCVFLHIECCRGLPSLDSTWMEVSCEGKSDDSIAVRASTPDNSTSTHQHTYNQQFSFPVRHERSAVLITLHGANKGVLSLSVMDILRLGSQTTLRDFAIPGIPGATLRIKLAGRVVDETRNSRADSPVEETNETANADSRTAASSTQAALDPRIGTDLLHDSQEFTQLAACVQEPTHWKHHGFQAVCIVAIYILGLVARWSTLTLTITVIAFSYLFHADIFDLFSERLKKGSAAAPSQQAIQDHEKRLESAHALLSDQQGLSALYDPSVLPPWVRYPDEERSFWLQQTLELIWPAIGHGVLEANVRPILEDYLRQYKPGFLSHLNLQTLTFGSIPPVVCGIKQYTSQQDNRERLIFDIKLHWAAADSLIDLRVGIAGYEIPVVLRDASVSGNLRIALDPLIPIFPCFGALDVAFTTAPQVDFRLDIASLPLTNVPGASFALARLLRWVLSTVMLWPARIRAPVVNMTSPAVVKALCPPAEGIFRVKVLRVEGLPPSEKEHWMYLLVSLNCKDRVVEVHRTKFDNTPGSPTWDQRFEMVLQKGPASLRFELKENGGPMKLSDVDVGSVELTRAMFEDNVLYRCRIPLSRRGQQVGVLVSEIEFKPFLSALSTTVSAISQQPVTDPASLEDEWCSGVLFAHVLEAVNLVPSPIRREKSHYYVNMVAGNVEVRTQTVPGPNPRFDRLLFLPIYNVSLQRLQINVMSARLARDVPVGNISVAVNDILRSGGILRDSWVLQDAKSGEIELSLSMRQVQPFPSVVEELNEERINRMILEVQATRSLARAVEGHLYLDQEDVHDGARDTHHFLAKAEEELLHDPVIAGARLAGTWLLNRLSPRKAASNDS